MTPKSEKEHNHLTWDRNRCSPSDIVFILCKTLKVQAPNWQAVNYSFLGQLKVNQYPDSFLREWLTTLSFESEVKQNHFLAFFVCQAK